MKKIMIALLMAAAVGVSAQAQGLTGGDRPIFEPSAYRIGLGYNSLISPDLGAIADLPQSEVTRGGISLTGQALLGNMPYLPGVLWGAELSYMTLYKYEIILPESDVTGTAVPLLILWEYPFMRDGDRTVTPLLQWGLGISFDSTQADAAGAEDTDSSTDLALMVGPGLSYRLNERMHLAALLKYYFIYTPDESTQVFNISANVGWNF